MRDTRMLVVKLLIGSLIVGFLVYAGIEARGLFFGPTITLETPADGALYEDSLILLKGKATRSKSVTANGNKVLIDLEGNFQDYLVLSPGYNIMTIVATDARGKSKTLTRHIFFRTDLPSSILNNGIEEGATTTDYQPEKDTIEDEGGNALTAE